MSEIENEKIFFQWTHHIKMLFNPLLWKAFFMCLVIPIILLGCVLCLTGKYLSVAFLTLGLFLFFLLIWILVGIIVDISGGFTANYWITDKGVYFSSGKIERVTSNVASIAGALAGSASTAGAGLLAESEMDQFIPWKKVKKIKVKSGMSYISIHRGFASKPIGLYCTKEKFQEILKFIEDKTKKTS